MKKLLFNYLLISFVCLFSQDQDFFSTDTIYYDCQNQINSASITATYDITGTIDIMVLIVAFPDRSNYWPTINNNNPYYPKLGAFPDGTLLCDYIDTNGPYEETLWIKNQIETFYNIHSGGRFTANVTFPQTTTGNCYTTTHDFAYWVALNGSSDGVVWQFKDDMANEVAAKLVSDNSDAFLGIDMVQVMFVGVSKDEFHDKYAGVAYTSGFTLVDPLDATNVFYGPSAGGYSRTSAQVLHESLHVFGKAAGSPGGFIGLPDRGYDRPFNSNQFNATATFDIMYHNNNLITQRSLYGTWPMLTHDLLYLGWLDNTEVETISTTSENLKIAPITYALNSSQLSDGQKRVYKIMIHEDYFGSKDEYFLIEYKNGSEFDKNLYNIDELSYSTGLLIWHIKENRYYNLNVHWGYDNWIDLELAVPYNGFYGNAIPNDLYPRDYARPSNWCGRHDEVDWLDDIKMHTVGSSSQFYYLPDGGRHYWETTVTPAVNSYSWDPTGGDWFFRQFSTKSDFYSDDIIKGVKSDKFTPYTRPSSQDWDGNTTGIAIRNINYDNDYMSFNVYYNYWESSISTNTTWSAANSPYYIGANLTIESGAKLTIDAGTIIKVIGDSKIIVDGTLDINGTSTNPVTFTSDQASPSYAEWWNGIDVYGTADIDYANIEYTYRGVAFYSGASGSIDDSNISHVYTGIYIYRTSLVGINNSTIYHSSYGIFCNETDYCVMYPVISNTTIDLNDIAGFYNINSSTEFYDNTISNCVGEAINVNTYGFPTFTHNQITGCMQGADVDFPTYANFGQGSMYGNNSFTNITSLYISSYGGTVKAENNWWGTSSPSSSKFYNVDYTPWLTSLPLFKTNNTNEDNQQFEISSKLDAISQNNSPEDIEQSIDSCKSVIESKPESEEAVQALLLYWQISRTSLENSPKALDEYKTYLQELTKSEDKTKISGNAQLILAGFDIQKNIATLNNISEDYADSYIGETALSKLFMYYYSQEDYTSATEVMANINKKYPKSSSAKLAANMINSVDKMQIGNIKVEKTNNNTSDSPESFALYNNYPNPFNPSTNIKFSLAEASKVTIEIFNVLGQKVRTFKRASLDKGLHQITWDGRNELGSEVTSGLYIMRFTAKSANQTYNAVNRMLLIR